MQLSELINQLQTIKEKHGDKEISIFADAIASHLNWNADAPVGRVEYDEDTDDVFIEGLFNKHN